MFWLVTSVINGSRTEVAQMFSLNWTILSGTLMSSSNRCNSHASSMAIIFEGWNGECGFVVSVLKRRSLHFGSFCEIIFKLRNLKLVPEIHKSNILLCENAGHGLRQMNCLQRILQNWQEKKFGRD